MTNEKLQWCWASTFSLGELEAFDRVTLLGNRFRADIGAKLSTKLDAELVEWVELPTVSGKREFISRPVHIRYFSESRKASRSLFESSAGQKMLREIGSYLAREIACADYIWTGNSTQALNWVSDDCQSVRCGLEEGGLSHTRYLSPRQAGTNAHKHCTHAAAIYSAKPSPNLINLLNALDIPADDWTRSVEHETILQFMTRTSVRDAGNSSAAHQWVFDRDQALYLKGYFDGLGYVTATMELVENGPIIPCGARRGPKAAVHTPQQLAEYKSAKRAKDAERKRRKRAEMRATKVAQGMGGMI